MSERGSFTTEYMHCDKCIAVVKQRLIRNDKFLKGVQIPSWEDGELLPIIAGKIGGSSPFDIYDTLLDEATDMADKVCHPVRISLIPEEGDPEYIVIDPEKKEVVLSWESESHVQRRCSNEYD